MARCALHERLGDKFIAVLWWTLAQRYFLFLESMHVARVRFVALHAEGEVLASQAIKAKHLLWDRLHAFIATEPQIIAIFQKLLLGRVLGL